MKKGRLGIDGVDLLVATPGRPRQRAPEVEGPPESGTISAVLEAAEWLASEGVTVNVMQAVTLAPFPADEIAAFLGRARRSAIIEGNYTGQPQGLVRQECLMDVNLTLHRYDGRPFSPEQISEWILEVLA